MPVRKLQGTFVADGADGRRYAVQVWMNYVKAGGVLWKSA
jgi:hypothetical protein